MEKNLRDFSFPMMERDIWLFFFRVKWESPLEFDLGNGMRVFTSPPPGSGAIMGAILKIMKDFKSNSTEELFQHRFIEASKFAFAQRSKLGDWDDPEIQEVVQETVDYIQGKEWINWVQNRFSDAKTEVNTEFYGAKFQYVLEDHGTSHISILAPNGDAISATSTVNTYFGSGLMSKSTRIPLNNEMDDFSTPNTTNVYGIPSSSENYIRPGKRPASSMSPSIVVDKQNEVKLVVGASGGPRIIPAVAYVTIRNLWLGEDIKSAIDNPRPHHQLVPMKVFAEIGTQKVHNPTKPYIFLVKSRFTHC